MKQRFPVIMLVVGFLAFGLSGLQAQNKNAALVGQAPQKHQQQAQTEERAVSTHTTVKSRMAQEQEAILALVEEMKANIENPNYDMAAAVKRLQQSPYVVYTLNYFDPEFPIVFRTGDAAKDLEAYNAAKEAWLAKQNN